jgi:hypothetical protein
MVSTFDSDDRTKRLAIKGPAATPTPRAPIIRPVWVSPPPSSSVTSTASRPTMPAPMAKVAFDASIANSTESRRAYPNASRMSAIGRIAVRVARSSRGACIGRRISATVPAATTNEAAFTRKATSRPKAPATTPPKAAPTANIAPHNEPNSTLAVANSPASRVKLGSAACDAGATKALSAEIRHRQR